MVCYSQYDKLSPFHDSRLAGINDCPCFKNCISNTSQPLALVGSLGTIVHLNDHKTQKKKRSNIHNPVESMKFDTSHYSNNSFSLVKNGNDLFAI